MNLTILSLSLSHNYRVSHHFSSFRELNMKKCTFHKFFFELVSVSDGKSVQSYFCRFSSFLSRPICFETSQYFSIIVGERYTIPADIGLSTANFFDCVFKDCISNQRGGAIYVENGNIRFVVQRCGFYHCLSNHNQGYSAGAISLCSGRHALLTFACFYNCSNNSDPASIQIVNHLGTLNRTDINNSNICFSGFNEVKAGFGDMCGGDYFTFNQNNMTRIVSGSTCPGGIVFSVVKFYTEIGKYCQMHSSTGLGFVSSICVPSAYQRWLINWNFINNTSLTNSWICHWQASTMIPCFDRCCFIQNSDCKITSHSTIPTFTSCSISNLSTSNRVGTHIDTIFDPSPMVLNDIAFENTQKCWERLGSDNKNIFTKEIVPFYINTRFNQNIITFYSLIMIY